MTVQLIVAEEVGITLVVTVPKNTPECDKIYITGNHRQLGRWSPNSVSLTKVSPQKYEFQGKFKKNTRLYFKFTRGSWNSVEKDKDFHEVSNRALRVQKPGVFRYSIENWSDLGCSIAPRKPTWVGDIRSHPRFFAKKLHNYRNIWVYLPPGYEDNPKKRYPVLYAHDGNNVFDRTTAFLGVEWELDDTAEMLIRQEKMREIIIVAIENTPQREAEYTHVYLPPCKGGKADLYADFIINDLKPFIDQSYRTLRNKQYTAVMGSSLGGLVSLYLAWKYPDVFSMAGVVSPSVWWAERDILQMIRSTPKPAIKIWLDIGTLEGKRDDDNSEEDSYAVQDVRELRGALIDKGFHLHYDLEYLEVEGGEHNEAAWARRVDKILLFFFGCSRPLWKRLLHFN